MRTSLLAVVLATLGVVSPAAAQDFSHFGSGIAFLAKVTGPDHVEDATVDANGIVRINRRVNTSAGLVLELHQLFALSKQPRFGFGPFIGIQAAGDNKIIDAIGAGIMFGFRPSATSSSSLNIGIGYAGVISVKSLGDEFVPDTKAPTTDVTTPASGTTPATITRTPLPIRYETHDAGALMLVTSFMF